MVDISVAKGLGQMTATQEAVLRKMGITQIAEAEAFDREQARNPAVKALFKEFESDFAKDDKKYDDMLRAFGKRIKAELGSSIEEETVNPVTVLDSLNRELSADKGGKARADAIKNLLRTNPDQLTKNIPSYKEGELDKILGIAVESPVIQAKKAAGPAAKEPDKAVAAAHKPKAPPPVEKPSAMEVAAANAADVTTSTVKGDPTVKKIAKEIATTVLSNFPELEEDVGAFSEAIEKDPALQKSIADQINKNPDFLKQLDGMKSAGALSPKVKSNLRPFVQKFLHNPQALGTEEGMKQTVADFNKAKGAAQTAGMEEMLSKWGIDSKGMPGFFSGAAGQAMAGVEQVAYGFSGGDSGISRPVLSFRTSGGSMFPSLMINLANFRSNQAAGAAFARYSPEDMTAYGIMKDGKPTHQEAVMGADGKPALDKDGKPVFKEVPNTMTVKTASGKEEKIIPAVGVLMAMQEKGSYAADGTWKPGNYRVPVVNNISSAGASTSIKNIIMTEEQFMKFKEDMRVASGGRNFPSEPYTQQDALAAGIRPDVRAGGVRMATVDPSTGAVAEPKMEYPAGPQPSGATTHPVRDPKVESRPLAANDRDYELQA